MHHPLGFLIFRDSKAGMVPSTLGMCRYISHSEIVCRGPKKSENPWYRACVKYSLLIFVEKIYKMQSLEVSGAVRPIYGSLGVKRLISWPMISAVTTVTSIVCLEFVELPEMT